MDVWIFDRSCPWRLCATEFSFKRYTHAGGTSRQMPEIDGGVPGCPKVKLKPIYAANEP